MPPVEFSVKLERIHEELLYRDPGGGIWLSAVCTLDEDSRGRMIVAQSIPAERYKAGERGPQVGFWREIGSKDSRRKGAPKGSTWRNSRPLPRSTSRRATANTRQVRREPVPLAVQSKSSSRTPHDFA